MDEDNILEKELQRSFSLRMTNKNLGMRMKDGVMVLDFARDERLPQPVAQAMQTAEQYGEFYKDPGEAFVPTGEGFPAAGRAALGGVRDAGQGFLDMTGELGELAEGVLPMGYITFDEQGLRFAQEKPVDMQKIELPEVPAGDSAVENLARGFVQFAAGMAAAPVRGLGYGVMMARSGFADALFDPEQGNLSTAINELGLGNAVTELLDSKVGEDADAAERLKARLLQVVEGGIVGGAVDAAIAAIRTARGDPELKNLIKRSLETVKEEVVEPVAEAVIPGVQPTQRAKMDVLLKNVKKKVSDKPIDLAQVGSIKDQIYFDRKLKQAQNLKTVDDALSRAAVNHRKLDADIEGVAQITGVTQKKAPLKGRERTEQKLRDKYYGRVNKLADLARGGVEVQNVEQADEFIRELSKKYQVIDEGWRKTGEGYFDKKLIILFEDGQVGEVQIWPSGMLEAKEERGGHDLYKIIRDPETSPEERRSAVEQSEALYGSVLEQLDESLRAIIISIM